MNTFLSRFRRRLTQYKEEVSAITAQTARDPGADVSITSQRAPDMSAITTLEPLKGILEEISKDAERILAVRKMDQEYAEAYKRNDNQKCREINSARPQYHRPYLDHRARMYKTIVQSDSDRARDFLRQVLKDQRWFVRQFAAEALTFLSEGKVDLTKANYPVFCERLTNMIASNRDYTLLAYRSTFFFQYYNLADADNEAAFVSGYRPYNSDDSRMARKALTVAGPEAVDDILRVYSEITDGYARSDLIAVLMEIDDSRAKPVVLGDLLGNKIPGNKETIRKWCIRDIKKEVDSLFRSDIAEKDKRRKLTEFLIALGAEGNGKTAIFCECGYPVRVRYTDCSEGPINDLCIVESCEYTNTFKCGNCGRFVCRITM
ncbi:MAG: HEAT repeat domain-containing protein [Candidatus Aminicenantes bacterium]|nr:HEAT repeat domain-containing protein [Candidatus Aminicenantes bacterium]